MRLYFKGHDYKYAAEQMLLTLFPDQRPVYPDAPPEEGDYAPADSAEDFDQPRPRMRHSLLGRRNRHEE